MRVHFKVFSWLAAAVLMGTTASSQEASPAKQAVPNGYTLIEGDILVPLKPTGGVQAASPYPSSTTAYWPNGVVPYEFEDNLTPQRKTLMLEAMDVWQAVANVTFVPHTVELNWLYIQDNTVQNSAVGKQFLGPQEINIANWNTDTVAKFRRVHELGHALGFWHTQSRSDRNQYIFPHLLRVTVGDEHNFDLHDEANHYGPYDFGSVMHYGQCAFSFCSPCNDSTPDCWTIEVLGENAAEWQTKIGQRQELSKWDALIMSFLYPKIDWRFVDLTSTTLFDAGTFLEPYHSFPNAINQVPLNGTVWITKPQQIFFPGVLTKPMILRAPLGGVQIRGS